MLENQAPRIGSPEWVDDEKFIAARTLAQEALSAQEKIPVDSIDPETIRNMIFYAFLRQDARELEPVRTMLEDKAVLLETNLGLSQGQATNDPELTDLRALIKEVNDGQIRAWEART